MIVEFIIVYLYIMRDHRSIYTIHKINSSSLRVYSLFVRYIKEFSESYIIRKNGLFTIKNILWLSDASALHPSDGGRRLIDEGVERAPRPWRRPLLMSV